MKSFPRRMMLRLAGVAFGLRALKTTAADEVAEPDSRVLILADVDFRPAGMNSLPAGSGRYRIKGAVALAVALNRDLIERRQFGSWYVVSPVNQSGYRAMRVSVPAEWRPADEFAFPPDVGHERLTNLEAKTAVRAHNGPILAAGERPAAWAVHVKALRRVA